MRNPFSELKKFWNRSAPPEPDDSAVPNRAAFRAMGLRGRRGAQLVKQRIGATPDMDAHDEFRWIGIRKNKFVRPRLGRGLPWFSHQQAYVHKVIRRQAGAINNRRWQMDKIIARRKALGIEPSERLVGDKK